jgi:hypothetical protein
MTTLPRLACRITLPLALALPAGVHAAVHCVGTPAALAAALETSETNGQDDDLRVVSGTYGLTIPLVHSSHEAFSLLLSGRWNAGCTVQGGAASVLDGGGTLRILYVFSDATADLAITDLTFSGGHNTAGIAGAGLSIETSSRNVRVERNLFFGNSDSGSAGGARIAVSTADSVLTVRNNIALGNSAPEGAGIVVNAGIGVAHVVGNTIVANTTSIAGALCGGLCISGGSDYTLSNNILWSNPAGDLHIGGTGTTLLHSNDIGAVSGSPPDGEFDGISVDPGFAPGLLNLNLAPDSPLVNRGRDDAIGGIGALDAAGAPRRQGAHVDIGAYESDVLFRDGFEQVVP